MWAGIEEGFDVFVVAADDQDRLVADRVLEEIAGIGNLLFPACNLPDAGPQAIHLEVEELLRRVASARDDHHAVGLAQCVSVVGNGHQLASPSNRGPGPAPVLRQTGTPRPE